METTPAKSKPLHNFSLPQLKWAQSNQRLRRRNSPDPHHLLSSTAADSDSADNTNNPHSSKPTSNRGFGKPFMFSSLQQQGSSSQLLGKKRDDSVEEIDEGEGDEAKPRKLRPRKAMNFPETSFKKGGKSKEENCSGYVPPKPTRARESNGSERQRKMGAEKSRLWISLSREEIEEDVYALTGSRPARKPKKRAKMVQKQLDNVFPGLYLAGMTLDYYRLIFSKANKTDVQAANC